MCPCSALRRPTCFGLGCTCRFRDCGGIGQCVLLHSVCTSACTVEGRIATRTALVRKRAARISIARRAGHACSSSSTRWWDHYLRGVTADGSWCTSGGISLRPLALRCAASATRRATVESLRTFTCRCNGTQWQEATTGDGLDQRRHCGWARCSLLSLTRGNHLNRMPQEDAQALPR